MGATVLPPRERDRKKPVSRREVSHPKPQSHTERPPDPSLKEPRSPLLPRVSTEVIAWCADASHPPRAVRKNKSCRLPGARYAQEP